MKLERFSDAQTFYAATRAFLLEREVENNLLFGILDTLINDPGRYEQRPYFASVRFEEAVIAVALRTPPHNLVLSCATDLRAAEVFARDLMEENLPGVSGPEREAAAFVEAWQALTGQPYTLSMPQRLYKLERVVSLEITGHLRHATQADRPLLVKWTDAFNRETVSSGLSQNPERIVDGYLHAPNRALYLWEADGRNVSMVGTSGPTPSGVRVGAVYTPPEERKRGYASAAVARLSEQLLEKYRFCCLYTDLTNPTSNHIYQTIGYKPVCDVNAYRFEAR